MSESWRSIAYKLAARVSHMNHCDNGHADWRDGVRDGCPSCRDREAYAEFVAKAGGDPFKDQYAGPSVSVFDLIEDSPAGVQRPAGEQRQETNCGECGHGTSEHHKLRCEAEGCLSCNGWICPRHGLRLCGCTYLGGPSPAGVQRPGSETP